MEAGTELADCGLWARGAGAASSFSADSLHDGERFDLAVVGGGILGASAALHAAEAGLSVVVLEAGRIGGGASGRSGGQVWAGLKTPPSTRGAGPDTLAIGAADAVFALIDRLRIACAPDRRGTVQAVHAPAALPAVRERYEAWRAFGAPVEWLDREAMAAALGTDAYVAGWRHAAGGTVQPLAYTRGLAAAAQAAGARIYEASPVTALSQEAGGWRVAIEGGPAVASRHVLVATNALTGPLVPRLAATIIPLESAQIATAPIRAEVRAGLLAGTSCASDTRRSLLYFRMAPDGAFVLGGRGSFWGRTGAGGFERLRRHAVELFPALAEADWPHRWSGRVALTLDHVPHVHRLAPGLTAALGFNGRGIAMATAFGRAFAVEAAGGTALLPDHPLRPVPLHALHRLGVAVVGTWYQWRDLAEARSARPTPPTLERRKTTP